MLSYRFLTSFSLATYISLPDLLRALLRATKHPCLKVLPGYSSVVGKLGDAKTQERLLAILDLGWRVAKAPAEILDRIKNSEKLQAMLKAIPAVTTQIVEQAVAFGTQGASAAFEGVQKAFVKNSSQSALLQKSLDSASPGDRSSLTDATGGPSERFSQINQEIGVAVSGKLAEQAKGFVELIRTGTWWELLLDSAYEQIWPWGPPFRSEGVLTDIRDAFFEVTGAQSKLISSAPGLLRAGSANEVLDLLGERLNDSVDSLLNVWKILNTAAGRLGGWIFVGSVLIGALFFGVGAAVGAGVAAQIGLGILASTALQTVGDVLKAVYDLHARHDELKDNPEERDQLYERVAGGGLFLAIASVMALLGEKAARYGERVVKWISKFTPNLNRAAAAVAGAGRRALGKLDDVLLRGNEKISRLLPKKAKKAGAPEIEVAITDKGRVVLFRCSSPCTPEYLDDILKNVPDGHPAKQKIEGLREELAKSDTKLTGDDAAAQLRTIADEYPDLPKLKESADALGGNAPAGKLPNGGAVGPLRKLTPADLPHKPPQSPTVEKWVGKGGKVEVDSKGTWVYTDWEGNVVAYPGGHPDFKSAGLVKFEANVKQKPDYKTDYAKADEQLGRKYDPNTERWHHHEGGEKMQLIDKKLHGRFTHEGGVAAGGGK